MTKPIYMHSEEFVRALKNDEVSFESAPVIDGRPVFVNDLVHKVGRFDSLSLASMGGGVPEIDAKDLIAAEVERQDKMWGSSNERADSSKRQLMHAGMAQLAALNARQTGLILAFETEPAIYPKGWSGFRDYGSDIANLVVAAAFIQQEIKRKLAAGEDATRTSRTAAQPYGKDKPNEIEG